MKAKNTNLNKAKTAKNDEFYTQLSDIEKELAHYKEHFKDKIVFCNCDDPEESNFWFYFAQNFQFLGLKKLISTHYETDKPSYKLEIVKDVNADGKINNLDVIKTPLIQNGDFRSDECIELLKECDIVVTNPPFSLFREFVAQLVEYDKKFLIIGNKNAITCKEIFNLIKGGLMWLGYNTPQDFIQPTDLVKKSLSGMTRWFTNLAVKKRHEDLILFRNYNPEKYSKYDNYDAINVDKTVDIPMDYAGVMGVPISFMDKYNPEQFEILGLDVDLVKAISGKASRFYINGKSLYARVVIKNKKLGVN